jgi:membrane protein DedA with SNARE-associated domain
MLIHIHSGLRWLVLIFILAVIIGAAYRLITRTNSGRCCQFVNRFALTFTHLQILIGLILYFISPRVLFAASSMKDSVLRFFLVEHIGLMIVAAALITIGYFRAKKATDDVKKFKALLIYYSIALLLILSAIPWPFRGMNTGWF